MYDAVREDPSGTYRVLVDWLWPRGVRKDDLRLAEWAKDVAPSTELRKRFHADMVEFAEFTAAYRAELDATDAPAELLARAEDAELVLLVSAKDTERNHGLVLASYLAELQK